MRNRMFKGAMKRFYFSKKAIETRVCQLGETKTFAISRLNNCLKSATSFGCKRSQSFYWTNYKAYMFVPSDRCFVYM